MNREQIKAFQDAVGNASWNLSYDNFLERLNKPDTAWASDKWQLFQRLSSCLSAFDPETLSRLLEP